jgi:hypothetical protein
VYMVEMVVSFRVANFRSGGGGVVEGAENEASGCTNG